VDAIRFFSGHPHIPNHVWEAAAYDPPSGKVIYQNQHVWIYDPAKRDWEPTPVMKPYRSTTLRTGMTPTPKGVAALSGGKLYLYQDEKRSWKALPGGGLPYKNGDGSGICYDGKRNCLWVGSSKMEALMRYDLGTGKTSKVDTNLAIMFPREMVHVPEFDMLLGINRIKANDGTPVNLAFDVEKKKWVGLDLKCSDGKPNLVPKGAYGSSLAYDPELKRLFWFSAHKNNLCTRVLRPKMEGLKKMEVK
jgi:hypothetical protein